MAAKFHYLNPRTSTHAMRLEDFVKAELKDRTWNNKDWEGESVRRESMGRSVLESRREWLNKVSKKDLSDKEYREEEYKR